VPANDPPFSVWDAPPGASTIPAAWLQQIVNYLTQHPLPISILQGQGFRAFQIEGQVLSNGTTLRGTGFKSEKISTGTYTITFDKSFAGEGSVPAITPQSTRVVNLAGVPSASGFTFSLVNLAGSAQDSSFSFTATAIPA